MRPCLNVGSKVFRGTMVVVEYSELDVLVEKSLSDGEERLRSRTGSSEIAGRGEIGEDDSKEFGRE